VSSQPPPSQFPVSVKGVIVRDGRVLLLRNDRGSWELPGGRIQPGETTQECLAREVAEETSWDVEVGPILDAWLFHIVEVDRHIFVVTYGCLAPERGEPTLSPEHLELGFFVDSELDDLRLPEGYRRSVARWFDRVAPSRG
jgi:8-oxo-dGTP pyrophosphatase MutT (NUDIX family)